MQNLSLIGTENLYISEHDFQLLSVLIINIRNGVAQHANQIILLQLNYLRYNSAPVISENTITPYNGTSVDYYKQQISDTLTLADLTSAVLDIVGNMIIDTGTIPMSTPGGCTLDLRNLLVDLLALSSDPVL